MFKYHYMKLFSFFPETSKTTNLDKTNAKVANNLKSNVNATGNVVKGKGVTAMKAYEMNLCSLPTVSAYQHLQPVGSFNMQPML